MCLLLQLPSDFFQTILVDKVWRNTGQVWSSVWRWVCPFSPAVRMLATGSWTSDMALLGSGGSGDTF